MTPFRILAIAALAAVSTATRPATPGSGAPRPDDGAVVSLRVVPATGHAEVVIGVSGNVQVKDFTLTSPARIVVDITGATLGLPTGTAYDGVARGAITMVRYSQFTHDVVRVVLTVDAIGPYHVTRDSGEVHIGVDGTTGQFAAWEIGANAQAVAAPVLATIRDQVTPAAPAPPAAASDDVATASNRVAPGSARPAARSTQSGAPRTVFVQKATRDSLTPSIPNAADQQSQQQRYTFGFVDQPILEVLRYFSDLTHRTILASRSVTGNISATIVDQPWDVALRAILNANGFDATEDSNGIITVETFAELAAKHTVQQAAEPLVTLTVPLNFAKATAVMPMVAQRLSRDCSHLAQTNGPPASSPPAAAGSDAQQQPSNGVASLTCPVRGAISADSLTNSLSVTDVQASASGLIAYARSLDRRPPQVSIKAKIILVDRTALEGLGLRYDLGSQTQYFNDIVPRLDSTGTPQTTPGQVALGGNAIAAIANATQRIPSAALQLVYSTAMGAFDFTTFMEALQQTSLLDTQAEPSGSTLNNRTVSLVAGTEVPIRVVDAGSSATGSGSFAKANVSFRQTGVILTVTPQVTNNGFIQMVVHVENSDVTFSGEDATSFPKQTVDNTVLVPDGGTAVMGGLTLTTVSVTKTGIPLLVDLPVIGKLFGVTQRQETKRDLLILITPHIIDSGDPAGGG